MEGNCPDAYDVINESLPSKSEQNSNPEKTAAFFPPTTTTSLASNDGDEKNFNDMVGNHRQYTPHVLQRRFQPIQTSQQPPPIPEPPEALTWENRGHSDIFCPYDLPNTTAKMSYHPFPIVATVVDGFENMTLHVDFEHNTYVTGCLLCDEIYVANL